MADEQEPPRKVAKRVVKKTVVKRPAASQSAPTPRYGRPTPKASAPRMKAAPKTKASRPARPRPQFAKKAGSVGRSITGGVRGTAGRVGSFGEANYRRARAFRLPRIQQAPASALVGLIVGLIAVGIAVLCSLLFSELRGTSTGGGRWGSLTFVVVTFIAFVLGELLLTRLGVRQPRVTSFLGICLTLFAILAFFLGPVDGVWAWLIVPLLGAATFLLANRAVYWADSQRARAE